MHSLWSASTKVVPEVSWHVEQRAGIHSIPEAGWRVELSTWTHANTDLWRRCGGGAERREEERWDKTKI